MDIKEPREDGRKDPLPGEYGFPLPKELFYRELGFGGFFSYHNNPRHNIGRKVVTQSLSTKAVHTLCTKELSRRRFKLPNGARTTFHIAFSADGSKVASCHGDHNVYICDVASGEVIQTLSGHPRTPWCVVFHPSQNDVLASGCLAGQVRVWDLKGGSEVLVTDSGTVIASLAFHPTVRLLAIATFNEIIFWDWGHPYPLARCSTENTKEKVRLVRFDRFGHYLITGITNFPNPPSREEIRRPTRSGSGSGGQGPFFRPNILSRSYRGRRTSPIFGASREDGEVVEDGEGEVVEEVVVPDPEEAEAFGGADDSLMVRESLNDRQDRFQESYRQLVSHYEELVSNYQQFLRSRIPRIYEPSENSVPVEPPLPLSDEPMDAEPHVAINPTIELNGIDPAFIADALPSGSSMDIPHSESESLGIVEDSNPPTVTTVLESPSSPVVMDDEVPGPSRRLLFELSQVTAPETLENRNSSPIAEASPLASGAANSDTPTGRTGAADGRSDTDLQSIEALAQNILEMQNLCSQVRMDAPLAVENQHIMELRVIRRHLELLQEQTRDLQSSIRATLNSLATGSLAALRSHVASTTNSPLGGINDSNNSIADSPVYAFVNLEQATPPTPVGPGPAMDFESHSPPLSPVPRTASNSEANSGHSDINPSRRTRIHIQPSSSRSGGGGFSSSLNRRVTSAADDVIRAVFNEVPYSGSLESGRPQNAPLFNRIRVPPMVAMQYEVSDSVSRNSAQGSSRGVDEPTPGPSRDANVSSMSSGRGRGVNENQASPGPRRIVREFRLISGRPGAFVAEEHSRHCPFSGRDPYQWRPPPRMRSLYDMGEMPVLVTWPTMETGVEASIRNFRAVTSTVTTRQPRNPLSNITITVRNGFGISTHSLQAESGNSNRISQFMNFSEWLLTSSIVSGTLSSDVLVSIYLTIRQQNNSVGEEDRLSLMGNSEQWQQVFGTAVAVPGLALIPPSVRQGQRQAHVPQHRCQGRRRRAHWICCNHNGTSPSTSRPCSLALAGVRAAGSSSSNNRNISSNSNSNSQDDQNQQSNNNGGSNGSFTSSNGSISIRFQTISIPEESSSSSTSSNSSGYSSSSSEPICLRMSKREGETRSPSTSSSSPSPPSPTLRQVPSQLDRNFSRVFYIRASDELIPVYSTVNSSEAGVGTEVRESLQASVYYLPIGLFLQGGSWEANTQTIGIHWPPVTREEEYAVLDLRVSERPLPVYETDTRESYPNNRRYPRIRLDYDQTSLRVSLPTGFSLHFIQSGLTILDCISTSVNLQRPRAIEGTLWIDYLGPFLDALERMFGLRHARRTITSLPQGHHRVGAFLRRTPPWAHENGRPMFSNNNEAGPTPAPSQVPSVSSSSASTPSSSNGNVGAGSSGTGIRERERVTLSSSSGRREVGERLRTMTTRRIITLAPDAPADSGHRRFFENGPMILSHGYMYEGGNNGEGNYRGAGDRRFYFRHRHDPRTRGDRGHGNESSSSRASQGGGSSQGGTRDREGADGSRFIRFAVDTAASEVLRRNHHPHHSLDGEAGNLPVVEAGSASGFSTIGRPVESRIERVLNERGNRGVHSSSPPIGMMEAERRMILRLREFRRRVSMMTPAQWARVRPMMSSDSPSRFAEAGSPSLNEEPAPSSSQAESANPAIPERERERAQIGGESSNAELFHHHHHHHHRHSFLPGRSGSESRPSRRRPYSRIVRFFPEPDDDEDGEMLLSVPARIPRLSDQHQSAQSQPEYAGRAQVVRTRTDGRSNGPTGHPIGMEQWSSIRRGLNPLANLPRYQGLQNTSIGVELSGSARTRAAPQNRFPGGETGEESNPASNNNERGGEGLRHRIYRASRGRGSSNLAGGSNDGNNNNIGNERDEQPLDAGARFYPGYIPEILITPRTRPPTYYTMDAATTAFLSSRIQKWDFTEFLIPDITKRDDNVVVRECSLHSDACLDVSPDSEFLAVLQPSDSGSYSSVGIYSLRNESLGELLNVYHFDQNTVSVSISPSCDYLVVGYAGRGPLYRFVHPSRNIGKIISIARDEEEGFKLVHVKDLYADGQVAFMSINCMHWVPVSGYGIIYGTNTGDLVLLS